MPWKRYVFDILNLLDAGILLDICRVCNEATIFISVPSRMIT